MGRIRKILLINEATKGAYSFIEGRNLTATEWQLEFLECHGVNKENVLVLRKKEEEFFGTLSESKFVARVVKGKIKSLVVVTSAPHLRRSYLAFNRSLPSEIKLGCYAATELRESSEFRESLLMEYLKLMVYFVIA